MRRRFSKILFSLAVAAVLTAFGNMGKEAAVVNAAEVEPAGMYRSELTNEWIPETLRNQRPIAVMVDNEKLLEDHYKKHGMEMGFDSAESYETAACEIINHPDSLHRIEEEDGDDVYYLEECNGFVIVSVDGYIRTFFYPDDGIDYFNRQ